MDGQVARSEAELKDLIDQFVSVRVVQANGLDLSLFQFDFNLTWAVLFLNADKTIYGRYGTRVDKGAVSAISSAGFKRAMEAALALHKAYPGNKKELTGKTGAPPPFRTPESFPGLARYGPRLDPGNPNRSCMHCHEVQDAFQQVRRGARQPLPDELLWWHPTPDPLGLALDPLERATVKSVAAGSPAEKDGFKAADELLSLEGQPLISIADVQWVLHHAKEPAKLKAVVQRGGERVNLELTLAKGWRRGGDFSWRFFVHEAFYTGNLRVKDLGPAEKKALGLAENALALKVTRVGWPVGPPADAKKAGFLVDDLLIEVDRLTGPMTESDFTAYVTQKKVAGSKLDITILRGGRRQKLVLPLSR